MYSPRPRTHAPLHPHTHTHACTHARTHALTHARTHTPHRGGHEEKRGGRLLWLSASQTKFVWQPKDQFKSSIVQTMYQTQFKVQNRILQNKFRLSDQTFMCNYAIELFKNSHTFLYPLVSLWLRSQRLLRIWAKYKFRGCHLHQM